MTAAASLHAVKVRLGAGLMALVALMSAASPAAAATEQLISLIVSGRDAVSTAVLTESVGGRVEQVLPIIDGVVAEVPASRVGELSRMAQVVPDRAMRLQNESYGAELANTYPREVGADQMWASGNTGEGVTVAVIDTGVADVPDLRGNVIAAANLTEERTFVDTYGHGTFQAGLIAGNGASSDGARRGVAPGADLLSVKVADATGQTSLGQVLTAVQLVDSAADRFNVRVALLALDSGSPLPPEIDPLSRALRALWSHGVVVVVPAGNGGPAEGTIASPGNDPVLLTVGSVNDQGTPSVSDDTVSEFSARGPTFWDDEKPDLAAPGEHLVSLRAPGSTVDAENPNARMGDAYFKGSGTSMAAAVTAGAAALLLAERPELSPDDVKALMMATATPVPAGDATTTGAGVPSLIDAAGATELPELPDAPDMGPPTAPFTPPGLRFGWYPSEDGVHLWSPQRVAARSWAARSWADAVWENAWGARSWAGRSWAGRSWADDEWSDLQDEAAEWFARSWAGRSWAARQWAGRSWAARSWTGSGYSADDWMARQWAARSWTARSWTARSWTGEAWEARSWTGRSWAGRSWTEDEWAARQWAARSWSARSWSARSWSGRSWSARSWSGRSWSDEAWSARSWQGVGWA